MTKLTLLYISVLFLSGCGGGSSSPSPQTPPVVEQTRSFYMGFTPWPYDATINAVNVTYQKIQQQGDLVHHQIMQGIPWDEAFNKAAYPQGVEDALTGRLNQTLAGTKVLLSIDSLDSTRKALANNWYHRLYQFCFRPHCAF